jgi:triacylglycerol esterase/lipase EstA (alpha/beta hydrolase family)
MRNITLSKTSLGLPTSLAHLKGTLSTESSHFFEGVRGIVKPLPVKKFFPLLIVLLCYSAIEAKGQTTVVFGPEKYTRELGASPTVSRTFSVKDPKGAFDLKIEKGIGEAAGTVSAVIKLNGATVVDGEITREEITKSVTLKQRNKISVEITGVPGSTVILTISSPVIYTLYTHPDEPRLMRAEFADGKVVDYFGRKNSEGVATSLSGVSVTTKDNQVTTYLFDEQSRVDEIRSPSGVKLKFKWDSVTAGVVTLVSPDGMNQISAPIDFSKLPSSGPHSPHLQPLSFSFDSSTPLFLALERSVAGEPISGQTACVAAAKLISKACSVISFGLGLPGAGTLVCAALSGAIAYTGVGVALLPFVAESCPAVLLAVKTVCGLVAISNLDGNADAVCTKIHKFITTVTTLIVGKRLGPGTALISLDDDASRKKIPLILIHGIHGSDGESDDIPNINDPNNYWAAFGAKFNTNLKETYARYVFQYFSDVESVQALAAHLGSAIDDKLTDRPHVLLAHSMGGLVAKSYMVYFRHGKGHWAGTSGGDSTSLLITLATPHHGTPGANDTDAIDRYMTTGWETVFDSVNILYWTVNSGFVSPPTFNSDKYNRSDLRWDNYDNAIAPNVDANVWLKQANGPFRSYSSKVIAYGGALRPTVDKLTLADALKRMLAARNYDKHQKLKFANELMYYGLNREFGITDGMVPYESALLCDSGTVSNGTSSTTVTCSSPTRVRKFEPGAAAELAIDAKTLSITRRPQGFDHLDMLADPAVLSWVVKDLTQKVVVSTSLQVSPAKGPYAVAQNIGGTFSITNRGNVDLVMSKVLIGGRVGGVCPKSGCPDFSINSNVTLAPGKTYNYSGNINLPQNGTYTFTVAYERPDGAWVNPVDSENGTINKLSIVVQSPLPKPVVSTSLQMAQGKGPFQPGQRLDGSFSITNRGDGNLVMKQVLIAGRVSDSCPDNVCPDFAPIPQGMTLKPGQTYNYSGSFVPQRYGTYTFYVAFQKPDGSWVIPVEPEKGSINKLSFVIEPPGGTLTSTSPTTIFARSTDQIIYINGTNLSKVLYCQVQFPDGKSAYLYMPLGQVTARTNEQFQTKFKWTMRGTYQIWAFTKDGHKSNGLRIVVN